MARAVLRKLGGVSYQFTGGFLPFYDIENNIKSAQVFSQQTLKRRLLVS